MEEVQNRYAIRGFDITMDAILRMASQGDLYKAAKKVGETHYIENKSNMIESSMGDIIIREFT